MVVVVIPLTVMPGWPGGGTEEIHGNPSFIIIMPVIYIKVTHSVECYLDSPHGH